jgi:hypothetical protein
MAETYRTPTDSPTKNLTARLLNGATMPYEQYLNSPEWKERRKRTLFLAAGKCQRCRRTLHPSNYHCHHVSYQRLGQEADADLQAICAGCHRKEHAHLAIMEEIRSHGRNVILTRTERERREKIEARGRRRNKKKGRRQAPSVRQQQPARPIRKNLSAESLAIMAAWSGPRNFDSSDQPPASSLKSL